MAASILWPLEGVCIEDALRGRTTARPPLVLGHAQHLASWRRLGSSWRRLDASGGVLEASGGVLEASCKRLGGILAVKIARWPEKANLKPKSTRFTLIP